MIKLSVVIITFNEEAGIKRCLESVKAIADEVVVVDSFSTDKTVEICHSFGAKVIEHPFEGHIEQKNFALQQAQFDHILSLDGDECLDKTAVTSIKAVKKNWQGTGYSLNRLNRYCGTWIKHSGWYPDKKIRLVDRRNAEWQGMNPHDTLVLTNGAKAGHLKGDILHYTIDTISDHIRQVNYFTDISSDVLVKKGKKVHLGHVLCSPPIKFFRDYVIKRGFLDGFSGLLIAVISAHAKFLKYGKAYLKQRDL